MLTRSATDLFKSVNHEIVPATVLWQDVYQWWLKYRGHINRSLKKNWRYKILSVFHLSLKVKGYHYWMNIVNTQILWGRFWVSWGHLGREEEGILLLLFPETIYRDCSMCFTSIPLQKHRGYGTRFPRQQNNPKGQQNRRGRQLAAKRISWAVERHHLSRELNENLWIPRRQCEEGGPYSERSHNIWHVSQNSIVLGKKMKLSLPTTL